MKRLLGFFRVTRLLVFLQSLLPAVPLQAADSVDLPLGPVELFDPNSTVLLEPVTPLNRFISLTLGPQPITVRVRNLQSGFSVLAAPVHFEVMGLTGTLSASLVYSDESSLSIPSDLTGAATAYFHLAPFDLPVAVSVAIGQRPPLAFFFFPEPTLTSKVPRK